MKFALIALAAATALAGAATAQPVVVDHRMNHEMARHEAVRHDMRRHHHHRHQVCYVRHHHRVCHWQ